MRALGETVLRVKDLERVKRFYTDVVGLDILRESPGIAFLKVADGHGGHTQIIGLFHESLRARLQGLGVEVTIVEHRWCQWRSLYVRDPEGNILELVCYDEAIK